MDDVDVILSLAERVKRLRADLLVAEEELRNAVNGKMVRSQVPKPPDTSAVSTTFTEQVLRAVTAEVTAVDIVKKLGLTTKDRRRVYDVLKKEAKKKKGRVRKTTMGGFEPR